MGERSGLTMRKGCCSMKQRLVLVGMGDVDGVSGSMISIDRLAANLTASGIVGSSNLTRSIKSTGRERSKIPEVVKKQALSKIIF